MSFYFVLDGQYFEAWQHSYGEWTLRQIFPGGFEILYWEGQTRH